MLQFPIAISRWPAIPALSEKPLMLRFLAKEILDPPDSFEDLGNIETHAQGLFRMPPPQA